MVGEGAIEGVVLVIQAPVEGKDFASWGVHENGGDGLAEDGHRGWWLGIPRVEEHHFANGQHFEPGSQG